MFATVCHTQGKLTERVSVYNLILWYLKFFRQIQAVEEWDTESAVLSAKLYQFIRFHCQQFIFTKYGVCGICKYQSLFWAPRHNFQSCTWDFKFSQPWAWISCSSYISTKVFLRNVLPPSSGWKIFLSQMIASRMAAFTLLLTSDSSTVSEKYFEQYSNSSNCDLSDHIFITLSEVLFFVSCKL